MDVSMEIEVEEEGENWEAIKDQCPLHPFGEIAVASQGYSRMGHARDKLYLEKKEKKQLLERFMVITFFVVEV